MNKKIVMKDNTFGLDAPLVVSQIFDNCLYSGFYGRLDSERIKVVTERMLETIERYPDCDYLIIDLSNIELIDSAIAAHLIKISNTIRFTGVEVILCGIKSFVAQTLAVIDVQLEKFVITKDLRKALNLVYEKTGYQLIKKG